MTDDTIIAIIVTIVILAAVIVCAAFMYDWWANSGPIEGHVTAKSFEPAHSETRLVMVGKIFIPMTYNYPDKYQINVTNQKGTTKTKTISKDTFDGTNVGDFIKID